MTKETQYAEVRVLVGQDEWEEWQADVADEDWDGTSDITWAKGDQPRRIILRIPIQDITVTEVTLPENPSDPVQAEVVA